MDSVGGGDDMIMSRCLWCYTNTIGIAVLSPG